MNILPILIVPFSVLACGFGWRVRGGAIEDMIGHRTPGGDIPVRAFSAIMFALCAFAAGYVIHAPWWAALVLFPLALVSTAIGNFKSMDMGRMSDGTLDTAKWQHDFEGMSLHGQLISLFFAVWLVGLAVWMYPHHLLAAFLAPLPVLIAGALGGVYYEIGYRLSKLVPGHGWVVNTGIVWCDCATAFGEVFLGAGIGLSLVLSILSIPVLGS